MTIKTIARYLDNKSKEYIEKIIKLIDSDNLLKYFVLTCFFICALSGLINILLDLSSVITYSIFGFSIFYLCIYLFCDFKKTLLTCKFIIVLSLFIAINIVWFTNGGSYGPSIIIYQAIIPIFLFLINIKHRFVFVFLSWINMLILFLLEYFYPNLILQYDNTTTRFLDIFGVFILFLLIEIPLLYLVQQYLILGKKKAQKSEQITSAFLANISHEVRTPMNAIISFSELLKDNELDIESRDLYINLIKDNGNNLLQIINNVMDASKIQTDLIEVKIKPFKIINILEQLKDVNQLQIPLNKDIELDYVLDSKNEDLIINSDETIVYQILSNLISNAIKFTTEGYVKFGVSSIEKNSIKLFVSDTGKGIPEEHKDVIFNKFFQEENTSIQTNGIGLGLTISNELCQKLGGKMEVQSTIGKGSTFYVTIKTNSKL